MSLNYSEFKTDSKYVYLPRVGEEMIYEIKEISKVTEGNPKFHFQQNQEVVLDDDSVATVKKNLGYHIEARLANGKILSVNSLSAFLKVFKKYEINDGDHIRVFHIDKGEWEVEKLNEVAKKEAE